MTENIKELIDYSAKGILSKVIEKNDRFEVTLFCMAAGTDISEHTSTKPGFVYVVEGSGTFNLEGRDIGMTPGVFIRMGKNAIHSLRAKENVSFLLTLCA